MSRIRHVPAHSGAGDEKSPGVGRPYQVAAAVGAVVLIGVVGYLVLGGGGGKPEAPPAAEDPDTFQIEQTVERFEDLASTTLGMRNHFAAGALPRGAAAQRYQKYGYRAAGRAVVSGSEATVPVSVLDLDSGDEVSRQEWTFVKEGEKWKVKAAPLP